ncbi:MAG TPA: glycosyltransferase family 9 protein [Candidatus Sumerlaeota bacterium]|nr:glycosyltransferase family 9 protein [Candidatus Sumerlaeota bacterium]
MPSPLVSIVILTANRHDMLEACLAGLRAQTFQDFETILVDNAPSPATATVAARSGVACRIIENPGAVSYAEARNRGVRESQAPWIAFTDDDCVPDPAWLDHLVNHDPRADAVGGIVIPLRLLPFPEWWQSDLNWLPAFSVSGLLEEGAGSRHYPQTANILFRREILQQYSFQEIGGGFSQKKTRAYTGREDVELWRRLRLEGKRCVIAPRAVVYHDIPATRLEYRYLLRRAFNDGLAYYRRERRDLYVPRAIADMLMFPPALLRRLFPPGRLPALFRYRSLWAVRQAGFVYAHITGGFWPWRFLKTALRAIPVAAGCLSSMAKRAARRAVVLIERRRNPRRKIPRRPRNLLIAACGFLGDMVLFAPVLDAIRRSLPHSKITLLTHANGYELYEHSPLVDELILCPSRKAYPDARRRSRALSALLSHERYDAAMAAYCHDMPPEPLFRDRPAPLAAFHDDLGLPRRFWYELADCPIGKDFTMNEIENLHRLAEAVGAGEKPRPFRMIPAPDAVRRVDEMLRSHGLEKAPLALLQAGAGEPQKTWPVENWEAVADFLAEECDLVPVFIGDDRVGRAISGLNCVKEGLALNMCWQGDLQGMLALIARSRLLITNDSGPKHMAIALGVPTLTLYGYTDERRWGAMWDRDIHVVLRALSPDLTPEECLGLPRDFAMRRITTDMVIAAIQSHPALMPDAGREPVPQGRPGENAGP